MPGGWLQQEMQRDAAGEGGTAEPDAAFGGVGRGHEGLEHVVDRGDLVALHGLIPLQFFDLVRQFPVRGEDLAQADEDVGEVAAATPT